MNADWYGIGTPWHAEEKGVEYDLSQQEEIRDSVYPGHKYS